MRRTFEFREIGYGEIGYLKIEPVGVYAGASVNLFLKEPAMEITSGLLDAMVLQRTAKNVCRAPLAGTCSAQGALIARVTKASKVVKGFNWTPVGQAGAGKFEGLLEGLPCGGPYLVELKIVDSAGKGLDQCKARNVLVGDLWIAAGQSNMQGIGLVKKPLPKMDQVRAFYMDDVWRPARDPIHNLWDCVDQIHIDISGGTRQVPPKSPNTNIGPAVSFAQDMFRRTKVPQGVLACAHGGTSMAQWNPGLKDQGTRSLYGATIRRLVRNGGRTAGVIWYQGESDASKPACEVYTEKMKALIEAFRGDCGDENLPFVLVQISRVISGDFGSAGWNSIQNQQRQLAVTVPNVTTVPAIDMEMDDLIHISGPEQERLGRRLAQAMAVLKKHPKAGKLPIELDRISVEPDERTGLANIVVQFRNVVGELRSAGVPAGFALSDPRPAPGIFRTILDGSRVVLKTAMTDNLLEGKFLHYGLGLDPYCNITDAADRSLPVIGRMPLAKGRAMTPFVRLWRRSEMLAPAGDWASVGLLAGPMQRLETQFDFCDLHPEIEQVREDRLIYFASRVTCAEDMDLVACLGYDGPVKMWIDGRQVCDDPAGANPAIIDRSKVRFAGTKGSHDVVVVLGTNRGRAWGIYLRFERLDVSKELLEQEPERIVVPDIVEMA